MNSDEVSEYFKHPLLQPVYEMSKVWFDERSILNFHDPLAAVTLFDETVCTYQNGISVVTRSDDRDDGLTEWTADPKGPHEIGITVDSDRFFDSYFDVYN